MNKYQVDQPGIHEMLQGLRVLVDEYDDRVLVGEIDDIAYYGDGTNELHMVFNFPLMRTDRLTPDWIRQNQEVRLGALPPAAWPCNTLNNHDAPRVYSRYGDGEHDAEIARLSIALMLTLKGTPFLYNGEEIGMKDLMLERIDQFRDNLGVWIYNAATDDMGLTPESILPMVRTITRDKCRTPMQWANAPNAGFSPPDVKTWLPVNPNYSQGINVADQSDDPDSLLSFYKVMLSVRVEVPALIAGDYTPLHTGAQDYFIFLRSTTDQRCLVVLNYADQGKKLSIDLDASAGKRCFSSHVRKETVDLKNLDLAPFEILILEF
jgi:alpha-glucosidase